MRAADLARSAGVEMLLPTSIPTLHCRNAPLSLIDRLDALRRAAGAPSAPDDEPAEPITATCRCAEEGEIAGYAAAGGGGWGGGALGAAQSNPPGAGGAPALGAVLADGAAEIREAGADLPGPRKLRLSVSAAAYDAALAAAGQAPAADGPRPLVAWIEAGLPGGAGYELHFADVSVANPDAAWLRYTEDAPAGSDAGALADAISNDGRRIRVQLFAGDAPINAPSAPRPAGSLRDITRLVFRELACDEAGEAIEDARTDEEIDALPAAFAARVVTACMEAINGSGKASSRAETAGS